MIKINMKINKKVSNIMQNIKLIILKKVNVIYKILNILHLINEEISNNLQIFLKIKSKPKDF